MATALVIVGAGALGQAFAAHLAASGHAPLLLATPRSLERLLGAGRIRLSGASQLEVPVVAAPARAGVVAISADAADLPAGTGVIFTTKGHQLPAACAAVRAVSVAWVGGVQNGLVKDDVLAETFGAQRVLGLATIYSAGRQPSGEVAVSSLGRTYVGELDGRPSQRATSTAALLNAAGIPTEGEPDIRSVLWSKACNAAGIFGVSVLTRTTGAELSTDPDLLLAYLSLVRETAAIGAANGIELGDYFGFPIRTYVERTDAENLAARAAPPSPDAPRSFPSMTQDLLAGRAMESDAIFADLVARAERVGMAVPRLSLVRDLLRGLGRFNAAR